MAKGGSFEAFGAYAKVSVDTLYQWVKKHEAFAEAKKEGWVASLDHFEKVGMAGLMGELPKFNSTAWIFIMKCRFRAAGYRDHVENETTVKFEHDPGKELSEPELLKAIKALKE